MKFLNKIIEWFSGYGDENYFDKDLEEITDVNDEKTLQLMITLSEIIVKRYYLNSSEKFMIFYIGKDNKKAYKIMKKLIGKGLEFHFNECNIRNINKNIDPYFLSKAYITDAGEAHAEYILHLEIIK